MHLTVISEATWHKEDIEKEFGKNSLDLKTTSQRTAYQARAIIKTGWFSGFEILEIHNKKKKETYQQIPNTVIKMLSKEKTWTLQPNRNAN